jgi:HAD superfamily phosphatase
VALLLFDIDGVIRDVAGSYRLALAETVCHYSGWRPDPTCIDALKSEGHWNNDWQASLELLRRHGHSPLPSLEELIAVFSGFYFGGDPDGDPGTWRGGIRDEPLLVSGAFFAALDARGLPWGFVSGAEPQSARFVLEERLGLRRPPLIAMGEAPDKPDPTGLIRLADRLLPSRRPNSSAATVAYLGDTVADVMTVLAARRHRPDISWLSLAVAPPHLQGQPQARRRYEAGLRAAGADRVIASTEALLPLLGAPAAPGGLTAPSPPAA